MITDEGLAHPRSIADIVRAAVAAGAPAVQLRDKRASARELATLARTLRDITSTAGALLFVNDRVDVALAAGADGAHLGPDDLPPGPVRQAVPPGFLLGASTDDPGEARRLIAEGVDFIGCGTVYPTSTKTDTGSAIGVTGLQRVVASVTAPVVGIGGIDANRAAEVATQTSAAGVAVVGAVMASPDPDQAVRELLRAFSDRR